MVEIDAKTAAQFMKVNAEKHYWEQSMRPEANGKLYFIMNKAFYGLLESAKLWYDIISDFLTVQLGFTQTESDPGVFHFRRPDGVRVISVLLYVDDLLVISSHDNFLKLKRYIEERFPVPEGFRDHTFRDQDLKKKSIF